MWRMILETITLVLSLVAIIAAVICTWLAIDAKIEVAAMKRSTHSVQLVPVEQLAGIKTDSDEAMRQIHKEAKNTSAPLLDLGDDAF